MAPSCLRGRGPFLRYATPLHSTEDIGVPETLARWPLAVFVAEAVSTICNPPAQYGRHRRPRDSSKMAYSCLHGRGPFLRYATPLHSTEEIEGLETLARWPIAVFVAEAVSTICNPPAKYGRHRRPRDSNKMAPSCLRGRGPFLRYATPLHSTEDIGSLETLTRWPLAIFVAEARFYDQQPPCTVRKTSEAQRL